MASQPTLRSDPDHSATTPPTPDADIVRCAANGDREALGALYDRHAGVMLALGIRILGVHREAEDVLHDVFLEVWQRAGDYDAARGSVRSWLLLRMRSRSLDRARSHGFARVDAFVTEPMEHAAADAELDMDAQRARGLLLSLPHRQREVLELGYFHGLSISEISARLGVPTGTVKSRVAAALRQLRASLNPQQESS